MDKRSARVIGGIVKAHRRYRPIYLHRSCNTNLISRCCTLRLTRFFTALRNGQDRKIMRRIVHFKSPKLRF